MSAKPTPTDWADWAHWADGPARPPPTRPRPRPRPRPDPDPDPDPPVADYARLWRFAANYTPQSRGERHTLAHHPPEPGQNHPVAVTILLNKPFDMVTRFTLPGNAKDGQRCLADVVDVPGVYPVGRLDRDSEGLLLLTDDARIATRLLDPSFSHPRTYLVQVEGVADPAQSARLAEGVVLDDVWTRPARVHLLTDEPLLWVRDPPIRHRLSVPTSWLELTLTEGRNRQVRRMTAAVGLPTLRLVRWSILQLNVAGLAPGQWRQLGPGDLHRLHRELGTVGRSAHHR